MFKIYLRKPEMERDADVHIVDRYMKTVETF
jgi:hypothetical protein